MAIEYNRGYYSQWITGTKQVDVSYSLAGGNTINNVVIISIESEATSNMVVTSPATGVNRVGEPVISVEKNTRLDVFWYRVAAGMTTTNVVASGFVDHCIMVVDSFIGVKTTGDVIHKVSSSTVNDITTSFSFPSVETEVEYCGIVCSIGSRAKITELSWIKTYDTTNMYAGGLGALNSYTAGQGGRAAHLYGTQVNPGLTGNTLITTSTSQGANLMTIALLPEPVVEIVPEPGTIAYVGRKNFGGSGEVIVKWPIAHKKDDIILLFTESQRNALTFSDIGGLQKIGDTIEQEFGTTPPSGADNIRNDVYWMRATSNTMPNICKIAANTTYTATYLVILRGVRSQGLPYNNYGVLQFPASSTNLFAPTIDTIVDNEFVLMMYMNGWNTSSTVLGTSLPTLTNLSNITYIGGASWSSAAQFALFSGIKTTPGSIGTPKKNVSSYPRNANTFSIGLAPELASSLDNRNGSILDQIGSVEQLILLKNGLCDLNDTIGSGLELIDFKSIENILYSSLGTNFSNNGFKEIVNNIHKSFALTDEVKSFKAILKETIDSLRIEENSSGFKKGIETISIKHGDDSFLTYIVTIREDKYGNVILRAGQDLTARASASKQIEIYIENEQENLIFQTFYEKQINLHIENGGSTYADGTIYEVINLIYLLKLKGLLIKKQTLEGQFEKTIKLDGVFNKKRRLTCYATDRTGD